ncbi:hypothetical protein F7725_000436, partial [Dissostichus mawsoni]
FKDGTSSNSSIISVFTHQVRRDRCDAPIGRYSGCGGAWRRDAGVSNITAGLYFHSSGGAGQRGGVRPYTQPNTLYKEREIFPKSVSRLLPDIVRSRAAAWRRIASRGRCGRLAAPVGRRATGRLTPEPDPTADAPAWPTHGPTWNSRLVYWPAWACSSVPSRALVLNTRPGTRAWRWSRRSSGPTRGRCYPGSDGGVTSLRGRGKER